MKRYIKSESFDDSIVIYYKHEKVFEGDIGYAYDDLLHILQKDTKTKDSVIEYLNSFGDPLISEEEYDDVKYIVDTLIGWIGLELSQDYYDESEFIEHFYIDEIKNLEIFPAKQQIVSSTNPHMKKVIGGYADEYTRLRNVARRLKSQYPKGTRIMCLEMNDYRAVPRGTRGTVIAVDDMATIHVDWDNGSSLGLAYGEDRYRPLTRKEIEEES